MRRLATLLVVALALFALTGCELLVEPPAGTFEPQWKKEKRAQLNAWLAPLRPIAVGALEGAESRQ